MSSSANPVYGALVDLADTLMAGFDVVDLADRLVASCLDLLDVSAVGILLDDQRGSLRVLASSNEEAMLLELYELQNSEGPCLTAFRTGQVVTVEDLAAAAQDWPLFAPCAISRGVVGAYAIPLSLRERTIGALNLFRDTPGALAAEDLQLAQVLARIATIGILSHRELRRQELLAEQLQNALNSRIVIEQAKGVIAERASVSMSEAFDRLRKAARSGQRTLISVAEDVASGRPLWGSRDPKR